MTIAEQLTPELVRGEVQRFWNAFMEKNAGALMNFYSPDSSVFSSVSPRVEPGRLAAARRQREYFHKLSVVKASTGMIDVVIVGNAAIASYNFQFHATKVASSFAQGTEEDIKQGRATQVFRMEPDGKMLIVHEHLSTVEKH